MDTGVEAVADRVLKDEMPSEFTGPEYTHSRAYKLREMHVVKRYDGTIHRWPGPHLHVFSWCVLANGLAVGWNENPSHGWSFPVVRVDEQGRLLKKPRRPRATTAR